MKKEGDINKRISPLNLKLIAVGVAIIVIGFIIMAIGEVTTEQKFAEDIFSFRRIVIAPMISFFGFLFLVFAILYTPKKDKV